ncbi:hypothetical protein H0Z60_05800 [Ectothiorhodospiraceae bacterium WFHF3C12]|nr:hypothetical protein [Ectothiorhodospiraceae bacterium WFHF3C12]
MGGWAKGIQGDRSLRDVYLGLAFGIALCTGAMSAVVIAPVHLSHLLEVTHLGVAGAIPSNKEFFTRTLYIYAGLAASCLAMALMFLVATLYRVRKSSLGELRVEHSGRAQTEAGRRLRIGSYVVGYALMIIWVGTTVVPGAQLVGRISFVLGLGLVGLCAVLFG